jgi:Xaa-Pro aminopeptidase
MTELNTNSTTLSMPTPENPDPRLPRLADLPDFVEYMGRGWGTPDRTPPVVAGAAEAAAVHRERLSSAFAGSFLVLGSGRAPVRNNDCFHDFRPDSNFYWLTGCNVEDSVLLLRPVRGGHEAELYVPAPAYPGDKDFFADAAHGELWVGSAPGFADWSAALQLPVRPLTELDKALSASPGALSTGALDPDLARQHSVVTSSELLRVLSELRMVKDQWEIQQLREAVTHTVQGFASVIREIPTAVKGPGERWLQGTFERHARTFGNGAGYATIVGSGKHAPTLHWVRCDGPVLPEEVLLLDMGVETRSFYTADITRTFPASGTFSASQRQVHDLVEKAHRAGLAQVRPGSSFLNFHHAAMEVLANGLHDWGLLPVSVDEALSPTGQHHRRFLVCGIGHHLGLDVHDCAQSGYSAYQGAALEPGMVLTVEPGLYFHEHDLMVPPELRGIGVRLEDDVLVTNTGSDVLSDALPLSASQLEAWMAPHLRNL